MLPDDDGLGPDPKYRPAIDEIYAAHVSAGEYLPPLTNTTVNITSATVSTFRQTEQINTPFQNNIGGPLQNTTGGGNNLGTIGIPSLPQIIPSVTPPANTTNMNTGMGMNTGMNTGIGMNTGMGMNMDQSYAGIQARADVGLAQSAIDKELVDNGIQQQDEHWIKAYWRPAMGWLYMLICFMDFVGFPLISMFMPIIFRKDGINAPYVPWQSLTLTNGGFMHISFAAVLGIAAWTRSIDKISPK